MGSKGEEWKVFALKLEMKNLINGLEIDINEIQFKCS